MQVRSLSPVLGLMLVLRMNLEINSMLFVSNFILIISKRGPNFGSGWYKSDEDGESNPFSMVLNYTNEVKER